MYYEIIRQLTDVYEFITIQELAEMTGFSVSYVKQNLKGVKQELEKHHIELQILRGKGICLLATNEERKKLIDTLKNDDKQKPESSSYRRSYILETLIEYIPNYTIQLLSEELSVSTHTIQKDLEEIKNLLKKVHLKLIVKRNKGITIEGNEFFMRKAIILNNNSKYLPSDYMQTPMYLDCRLSERAYTYFNTCYKEVNIKEIIAYLIELEDFLEIHFTDISFGRVIEYVAVIKQRIENNHLISKRHKSDLMEVPELYLEASGKLLTRVIKRPQIINELEIMYLAARIYVADVIEIEYPKMNEMFSEAAFRFADKIGNVISNHNIGQDKVFIENIRTTFEKILFIQNFDFATWNNLHMDIQGRLTGLYGICMANLDEVEHDLKIRFKPDDVARVTLLLNNAIHRSSTKIKAVLVVGTDLDTAEYQAYKIEDEVKGIHILQSIYYKDFDRKKYLDNIVISTVHMESYDENYIEVTKHIRAEDIEKIAHRVESSMKGTKYNYEISQFNNAISEDLVVLDVNLRDKQELIQFGSELLKEKGYVEEGFADLLLEREAYRVTYIGNKIAIPHVFGTCVKKSGVVVIRLKHACFWDADNKVKLIFMLAINYKFKKEIRDFFKKFYLIISDTEKIQSILNAETSKGILTILKEEST